MVNPENMLTFCSLGDLRVFVVLHFFGHLCGEFFYLSRRNLRSYQKQGFRRISLLEQF